ncbi:hypothetical protein Tco_1031350, partial [Tanacetum coccineum]
MGDENPIRTLGYYSKPSHEGYRNTIELPEGNNVVPLRSDTIRLVQNECSFCELWSEDPNQHLKDFLKQVVSLDLNGDNRERTRLRTIDQSAGGKLRDINAKESWALLEDLVLYDNGNWNDPRDFAKPVKAISLPQDVPSTFDRRLIELENQVQRLMEAYIALKQPTQVNKITSSCEICSDTHDTQYCMENPEQAFVDASSRTYETRKQNRNPSSRKHVQFVNSIIILNKEDGAKEDGNMKSSTTEYEDHGITMKSEEEFEKETEEEIKEEEEDIPKHFDTFPTMKELRLHYNWIMSKRLGLRRKPSNLGKIYNFVGRVKGLVVFVGKFTYECNFMVLEDTTSVIDHGLGSVVFEKPFVEATRLVYD